VKKTLENILMEKGMCPGSHDLCESPHPTVEEKSLIFSADAVMEYGYESFSMLKVIWEPLKTV
jgi:hypothetical protein